MSSDARSRLHPLSLPFAFLGHLRSFAVPVFALLVLSRKNDWELWGLFALVPLMIFETWHYFTLRYWITGEELIVKQGVLFREERHVPLERIQAIDSTQNVLQRLFGVVEVRVETAGSNKPEAHLKVLSLAARDRLRRDVQSGRAALAQPGVEGEAEVVEAAAPESDEPGELLQRVTAGELMILGLNPWRGIAILAIGFGLAEQFQLFEGEALDTLLDTLSGTYDDVRSGGFWVELAVEAALVIGLVGLTVMLSVASVFVTLFGFSLRRRGDEFVTECGLFTRHSTTIKKPRVQFLSVQRPLFLRVFDRALVMVRTAGSRAEGNHGASTRKWLTPVVPIERVEGLVRAFLPDFDSRAVEWQGLSGRARRRMLVASVRVVTFFHLPFALWELTQPFVPYTFLLLVGPALWMGLAQHRRFAWSLTEDALLVRDGVVQHRLAIVPLHRIQSLRVSASPFDRWHRQRRLRVNTAGSGFVHLAEIPYLEAEVAAELQRTLAAIAEARVDAPGPAPQAASDSGRNRALDSAARNTGAGSPFTDLP